MPCYEYHPRRVVMGVRTLFDYVRPQYRCRVVVRKGGRTYIWWSDWWGDAISVIEGNETKEFYMNDDRINDILDKIAEKVIK